MPADPSVIPPRGPEVGEWEVDGVIARFCTTDDELGNNPPGERGADLETGQCSMNRIRR